MLGEARRGSLIPSGEKPGIFVQETRDMSRKVLLPKEDTWLSLRLRVGDSSRD